MYPTRSEARLIPSTADRSALFPLPEKFKLRFSILKPYYEVERDGEVFVLGISKEGFLVGFKETSPESQASWLCVRTAPLSVRLFERGQDSAEDIESFLAPVLTDAEIAELPRLVPKSDGSFLLLPFAMKPEKAANIFDPYNLRG